jgi:hypothetical protein
MLERLGVVQAPQVLQILEAVAAARLQTIRQRTQVEMADLVL